MIALDVRGVQADPRLAVARLGLVRRRGGQCDRRLTAGRADLDPPVLAAEREVDALFEAELLDVEVDLAIDVGDGDDHG